MLVPCGAGAPVLAPGFRAVSASQTRVRRVARFLCGVSRKFFLRVGRKGAGRRYTNDTGAEVTLNIVGGPDGIWGAAGIVGANGIQADNSGGVAAGGDGMAGLAGSPGLNGTSSSITVDGALTPIVTAEGGQGGTGCQGGQVVSDCLPCTLTASGLGHRL